MINRGDVEDIEFVLLLILILSILIESAIFVYMIVESDSIECNFIFCSFEKNKEINSVSRECMRKSEIFGYSKTEVFENFFNGEQINCSILDEFKSLNYDLGGGLLND